MSDRTTRQTPSRAELLRQKRQQPSRVPVMPVKKETPESAMPPVVYPFGRTVGSVTQQPTKRTVGVTTRSYPYSTPLRQTVSTPMRRKVYHTGANGVETRFPALPNLHFSWQWVSGFLTVAFLTTALLMIFLPAFKVKQIQVAGIQRVALEDVQAVVTNTTSSIFTIDRQKVINAVALNFPELHDISLKVNMSGVVDLAVQERQPMLVWYAGDYTFWVDTEGVLMTPRGDPGALMNISSDSGIPLTKPVQTVSSAVDYANLLLTREETPITQQDLINYIDPTVLNAAINLNTQLPSGTMMIYDPISGLGWKDPRGWKVYFGLNMDDFQFKLVEYQTILNRLTQIGIKPKMISVEHIDSPFFRTE